MNWPNIISMLRILLAPLLLLALLLHLPHGDLLAAALFMVAAATDGVDGYLARRYNQVTRFGKLLDPLADKLLIAAAMLALVQLGRLSSWVALVILGREFAVTALRGIAAAEGVVIAASRLGKLKTVSQIMAIAGVILQGSRLLQPLAWLPLLVNVLLAVAVALTLISGLDYAWRFWRHPGASGA